MVGTIYRAVTGDEVAEPVRRVGSAIGSFLMGGPVGLALNLAGVGAEKVLGFDFDKTAQGLLASVASVFGGGEGSDAPAPAATSTRLAWTPAQLSAYGVKTQQDGTLTRGDVSGADVLNTLEMSRLEQVKLAAAGSIRLSA